ncbi:flagellar FlbD family protein [Aquibacillus sp. 3ASR75-11]|uniref:Flagellar FlbD family protein n=1 Tax=Terrihalobacillus insolitus TaxID=2950438 RepID=A0A9X3WTH5_9BACI|nr:flagellar FlbD family protein [Terrihalobacillus insolitus]MDC3414130.1 flagellar FlbD family protein [Terrihalobacillus insolitus]MDC3423571.1 flagellar FlbD family protein [Terrihalobacillus insolitus]
MISVTRLNGDSFLLNAMLIEQIQSFPDTTITLVNNKRLVVKESEREIVQLMTNYYKQVGIVAIQQKAGDSGES